jgi:hypothetical protein
MDTPTNSQNALTVAAAARLGQVPSVFRNRTGRLNDDMAGGITTGFAIVSFRGKTWRIKHQGKEEVLLNEDRSPRYHFDVVILKASPHLSKVWYEHGYVEGSTAPPDCWSVDGKKPDPASPKLQNPTCAGCRWNAWGSSRSTAGSGKGKDCADSKRLAIVPETDIENQRFGGPMLLRVPPASLGALLTYANSLEPLGYPYYAVVTRISFDMNQPYPQLKFEPLAALEEDEALQVEQMLRNPLVERIISAPVDEVHTDGVDTTHVAPAATPVVPTVAPPPVTVAPQATVTGADHVRAVAQGKELPGIVGSPATPQGNDMRAQMRAMGLSEAQIDAALGPEPKPEPAPDPRIAQLKAMGLNDLQINAMLAVQNKSEPAPPAPTQAAPAEPPKQRRTRGPNKPKEAAPPASNGHQEPAPAAPEPQVAQAPAPQPEPAGDLPAGFEDMLEGIIAQSATKQ